MTTYALSPLGGAGWQFLNDSANVLSNGYIHVYLAGTTTPATTWADYQGNTANQNPIRCDAAGRPSYSGSPIEIWLDASKNYKFVITNSDGGDSRSYDHIAGTLSASALVDPVGAGLIGYSEDEIYPSATVGRKLQQWIDPRDAPFNAAGDGVTNDAAALLAAIAEAVSAGVALDGGDAIFAVSGNLQFTEDDLYIRRLKLKQLTPNSATRKTFYALNCNRLRTDYLYVDRNGNGTYGDLTTSGGIWVDGGSGHVLDGCDVTGDDKGCGIVVRNATSFWLKSPTAHDMAYDETSATDDQIQGIYFDTCSKFIVSDPLVYNITGNGGGVTTTNNNRGLAFAGCSAFNVIGTNAHDVGQGCDITGSAGNIDGNIIGGEFRDCYSVGLKFANSAVKCTATNVNARDCGRAGFIIGGPSESGLTYKTADITFTNCVATDPGSNGAFTSASTPAGFLIDVGDFDTNYPRGIRFIGCLAEDTQGVPTMKYGFANTITSTYVRLNEMIQCRAYGYTTAASLNMEYNDCRVTGTGGQNITSGAAVAAIEWDSEVFDGAAMHDNSSSPENITIKNSGRYRIDFNVRYPSNATGFRRVELWKNGSFVSGCAWVVGAVNGDVTTIAASVELILVAGDYVALKTSQNSGSTLNLDLTNSFFGASLIDAM